MSFARPTLLAPLDHARTDEAAAVLAAAFRDSPAFRAAFLAVDEAGRERKLARLFRGLAAAALRYGQPRMALAEGHVVAVALAYPPRSPLPLAGRVVSGLGALAVGPMHAIRLARLDAHLRRRHYRAPHWYLYVLGVAPARQRQGLGAALLRDLFARAEGDGVPTYLEADLPANVPYYQGFGFRVIQESVVPSLPSVTFWHMLRTGAV